MTIKYYVIGGQYAPYCYGGAETLKEAFELAEANWEYWDNWEGWRKPLIYRAEDVEPYDSPYGRRMMSPKWDTDPVIC